MGMLPTYQYTSTLICKKEKHVRKIFVRQIIVRKIFVGKIFVGHSCRKCGNYLHVQYPEERKFSNETDIGSVRKGDFSS